MNIKDTYYCETHYTIHGSYNLYGDPLVQLKIDIKDVYYIISRGS